MIYIVHISDIHYRKNWEENLDLVFSEFFIDLKKQLKEIDISKVFLAISGDVVQSGSDINQYTGFQEKFDLLIKDVGILKDNIIIVPGNHDILRDYISDAGNKLTHSAITKELLTLDEKTFNDEIHCDKINEELSNKFEHYINFEKTFTNLGINKNIIDGCGYKISESIGVYCINSAILSHGGLNDFNDKEKLKIGTRGIHKWLIESKCKFNILIMHHPLNWLQESCSEELEKSIFKSFSLFLSGHEHNQKYYNNTKMEGNLIICSAPALFTNKNETLGYSIINIDENEVKSIKYRQWNPKSHNFLPGVFFANNDDGIISLKKKSSIIVEEDKKKILQILENNLEQALESFDSQPIFWVEPFLTDSNEISNNIEENSKVELGKLICNPHNVIIKSPPQFGLTCLAHHLVKESFKLYNSRWLYLNLDLLKINNLEKSIQRICENYLIDQLAEPQCIVIDSYASRNNSSTKIINKIIELYSNTPIIIMKTIEDNIFFEENHDSNLSLKFKYFQLLALPRNYIRNVVSAYNKTIYIGENNILLNKVILELDSLNIHRTPLNCLYLLKSLEYYKDDSPVNRTNLLSNVLFILFNFDEIPTYKSRPDITDCTQVLGFFCANLITTQKTIFTREEFIRDINAFCDKRLISLESHIVFDVMHLNRIIIKREHGFAFKASYWIFYFAAHRMHRDKLFSQYIYDEKKYIDYPEILEFYTGINREGNGALEIIIKDMDNAINEVSKKLGISNDINPYKMFKFKMTEKSIGEMKELINKSVEESNLPDKIKDNYLDSSYDQMKPFNQEIQVVMRDLSAIILMRSIIAASRLLRNCEYEDPIIKKTLLEKITLAWQQIFKVIMVIAPIMASKGYASYEGVGFVLTNHNLSEDNNEKSYHDQLISILLMIPFNIINWFSNDLYSNKMSPLIYNKLESEQNPILKLSLIILIIKQRPLKWYNYILHYIKETDKDSYFMSQVLHILEEEYQYSYSNQEDLQNMQALLKTIIAKQESDYNKLPSLRNVNMVPNAIFPQRKTHDNTP